MRRLPVFFLIDVSESMIGEPIQQVEDGLATIITELKRDPYALETVYLSVLVFAGKSRTVAPLTDIISFYPPRLPIGGGTSLGEGLRHLMREMKNQLQPTTQHQKGDWRPIVFLFTDGAPTDDYQPVLDEWKRDWAGKVQVVAVSFGEEADTSVLRQITEHVLLFKHTTAQAYKEFFKWITASIQAQSQSVNMYSKDDLNLAPPDQSLLEKAPSAASGGVSRVDTNVATFIARCSSTQKHYLIKYNREQSSREMYGLNYSASAYRLAGSFALSDDYFALSEDGGAVSHAKVNTEELMGFPHCPCCGNTYGFCLCPCGSLFCADDSEFVTCPWCKRNLRMSRDGEGGDVDFNVTRTKG